MCRSTELTEVTEQPVLQPGQRRPDLPPGVVQAGLLAELDLDALPDDRTGGLAPMTSSATPAPCASRSDPAGSS